MFRNIYCTCPEPVPNKTIDYESFQQNKEVRSIGDATIATIRGFYVKKTPVLSISRVSTTGLAYQKQSEILNRITLSTSTEIAYTIENPESLKKAARVYNLFFVDGMNGFRYGTAILLKCDYLNLSYDQNTLKWIHRRIFKELSTEYFDYSGYYTIVLTGHVEKTSAHQMIKSILTDLWSLHIINVNILSFENAESGASVFTFFPYSENHCDAVQPVLWDYYIDGHFTQNKDIFATKLDNFYGCPITLVTYNVPPYVILQQLPNGTTSPNMDGIEGILFLVLSHKLNFRTVLLTSSGKYAKASSNFEMVNLFEFRYGKWQ